MYEGDRSRKSVLVDFGFRLPSAMDNRPLNFQEFMGMTGQIVYVSATPAEFEIKNSVVGNTGYIPHSRTQIGVDEPVPAAVAGAGAVGSLFADAERASSNGLARQALPAHGHLEPRISRTDIAPEAFDVHTPGAALVVEQIIRPTGLLDPKIVVRPLKHQIDETLELCRQRIEKGERVLITTLTKRTAEDLSDYNRELTLARSAAEKGLKRNASLLVAEARYYEGWALWNLGENTQALTAYDEARRIYNEAGRRKSVSDVLNAAATVHWKLGEYDKALRIYEECLAIQREIGSKVGVAATLNNIANIYKDRDQLANARRFYEESLALEKEIGIKTRICVTLFNLAGVLKMQGNLPDAKKMYEQALALARETGRKSTVTMSLQELAEIFYYKNDLATAKKMAETHK
jgi:tetratricopeptide (TPR) repeat protein